MNKISLLLIIFYFLHFQGIAQTNTLNYKDVDSLTNSTSILDNLDALKLLNGKYLLDTVKSSYWVKHSLASFNSYRHAKAINDIDRAIYLDNTNSNAYYKKARLIIDIDANYLQSINLLDTALKYHKKGEYYFYRGIYYQMSDSISKALLDYDNASRLRFEHQGLYRNYSILLLKSGKLEKALEYANKSINLNPEIPQNYNARGKIYIQLINPDKACIDFEKAIAMGHFKLYNFRKSFCVDNQGYNKFAITGDLLFEEKKYDLAIKAYTKSIEEEKDTSRHYLNRGYSYFKIEDYKHAEKDYLKALTLEIPNTDLLYDNLSLLYFNQNNYEKSIEYAEKRIKLNPENHIPYIDKGLSNRKLKKYKQAEKDFNTAIKIKSDFFRAYGYRAYLYLELGQYKKSLEDAYRSIQINPEYGYGYLVLAQAKIKLNQKDFCHDLYMAKNNRWPEAQILINNYCK